MCRYEYFERYIDVFSYPISCYISYHQRSLYMKRFNFRELLSQDRIRVHINLFVSLVMCGIVSILWDFLVRYDKITNPVARDTLMFRNTVSRFIIIFLPTSFEEIRHFPCIINWTSIGTLICQLTSFVDVLKLLIS